MNKKLCACLLGAVCLQAAANDSSVVNQSSLPSIYIGGGIGTTDFYGGVFDDADDDFSESVFDLEAKDNAIKIYSGINFNRIVGIELSYTDYGKVQTKHESQFQGQLSPKALAVTANVGYTFDSGFRAFALTGMSALDLQQSNDWFEDEKVVALRYGLGGEYHSNLLDGITFRLAYEADLYSASVNPQYRKNNSDSTYLSRVDAWYLGVGYNF